MEKQKRISKWLFSLFVLIGLVFLLGSNTPTSASVNPKQIQESSLSVVLPDFKLPWPPDWNGKVSFRGGPHKYCPGTGGPFTDTYIYGEGSGIDFASGQGFPVAAMANGRVFSVNTDPKQTQLGCIVAIRHDIGSTILIYGHLNCFSDEIKNLKQRFITEEVVTVSRGEVIGQEGNSGSGSNKITHLHLELRDGKPVTNPPKCDQLAETYGSPVGWEILNMINGKVDGYWFYGYVKGDHPYEEGATMYNYDGVAVRGERKVITNFSYNDAGVWRHDAKTFVGVGYTCPSGPNADCEDNAIDPLTQFSKVGRGGIWGNAGSITEATLDLSSYGLLYSTNQWNIPSSSDSATFVSDVTLPDDGPPQSSGANLIKTWRVPND